MTVCAPRQSKTIKNSDPLLNNKNELDLHGE